MTPDEADIVDIKDKAVTNLHLLMTTFENRWLRFGNSMYSTL